VSFSFLPVLRRQVIIYDFQVCYRHKRNKEKCKDI